MKKGFEKFLAISTGVINLIFLVLIALIIFKKIEVELFDNQLVVTLLSILGAINIVLIGFLVTNSFIDKEALAAIMLFSDKTSSTRASMNVVKNIVRRSAKQLGNIKVGKIALFLEENNGLRMRITIKVKEDQIENAVDKFRCLLIDEFMGILDVEFNSIDFKVTTLKTNYQANMNKVEAEAKRLKEERAERIALEKQRELEKENKEKKNKEVKDVKEEEGTLQENVDADFQQDIDADSTEKSHEYAGDDLAQENQAEINEEKAEESAEEQIEEQEDAKKSDDEKDEPVGEAEETEETEEKEEKEEK